MAVTPPRTLEDALREETELAEIGAEYARVSEGLVGAARVEARAAGAQYRLIHRMWQLATEAREQSWRVESRWLRPRANVPGPSSLEPAEQTLLDVADEVGPALRLPPGTAVARVRDAVLLAEDLPDVLVAFEAGEVGHAQVRVVLDLWRELVEGARGLPVGQRPPEEAVRRMVEELLDRAPELTAAQLRALARTRRARLLRASEEARHRAALTDRRVWVEPQPDGMALLCALLDAATAAAVHDRLVTLAGHAARPGQAPPVAPAGPGTPAGPGVPGALAGPGIPAAPGAPAAPEALEALEAQIDPARGATPIRPAGSVAPGGPAAEPGAGTAGDVSAVTGPGDATRGERRTPAQWRADVLADLLLDGEPACWPERLRGIRGHVSISVPALSLLEHIGRLPDGVPTGARDGTGCAELTGYGPVPVSVAAQIAARAPSWTRVLTHPLTGVVLDHDRTTYAVPADLARLLRTRDGTCRFPGCRRAAARCDVDHTVAWADGGRTAADNLAHLCRRHHLLKHKDAPLGHWNVRREGSGPPGAGSGAIGPPARPGPTPTPGAAEGVLVWTSPAGRVHRTYPASSALPVPDEPPPF